MRFLEKLWNVVEKAPKPVVEVFHGLESALDVPLFGLLRSKEHGQRLVERGVLTPTQEKGARIVGEVVGGALPFAGASKLLQAAKLVATKGAGRFLRVALEGALGGAWGGASYAVRTQTQPVEKGAIRGALTGAAFGVGGSVAGAAITKAATRLRSVVSGLGSPELQEVKSTLHRWLLQRRAAENRGLLYTKMLQRAAGGDKRLLEAAHLARAWLSDRKFHDPQAWKADLTARLFELGNKLKPLNPEMAEHLERLRASVLEAHDDVIKQLAQVTGRLHRRNERLNRRLAQMGLEEVWQHPHEIYVPRYVTEEALVKRGIQPDRFFRTLFTSKPSLLTPHRMPRELTLEDVLAKFKPGEVTLDVSLTLPIRLVEHERLLADARLLNRLKQIGTSEFRPGYSTPLLPPELTAEKMRLAKTLAQRAAAGSRAAATALERLGERVYMPQDAARWLSGRLQAIYHDPGPIGRFWQQLQRATTRVKVYLPWDWVTQMVFGGVGTAKNLVTSLSPISRLVYALGRKAEGKKVLREVSPELEALVDAGLDIGGREWHKEALEKALKPVRSAIPQLWRSIEKRVLEPVEAMAFGPTTEMRVGLALDLFRRFKQQGKPEKEAAQAAASIANFVTGSVFTELLHPTVQQAMRYFVLAPRWLAHTLQLPLRAAGLAHEPGLSPEANELVQRFLAGYFMNNVLAHYALANALNRKLTGRNIWENPPGYRHLVDITPLVGTGPQGERQYFDPWFFWRDYPRLARYVFGQAAPERYFVYKFAPLVAVAADVAGYDLSTGRIKPLGLEERVGATVRDMLNMLLPASTVEVPGAGFSVFGGWTGTPTGRFDPLRQLIEMAGFRMVPGPKPVMSRGERALPGEAERLHEAARQGLLRVVRVRGRGGKVSYQLDLEPGWKGFLTATLGKRPTQQDVLESLDILGLPDELRRKAIRNIFSEESKALFRKYFRTEPTPAMLWALRTVLAQDNPADRERVLRFIFSKPNLDWMAGKLGRRPTMYDVLKYHKLLLRKDRHEGLLGTDTTVRSVAGKLAQ